MPTAIAIFATNQLAIEPELGRSDRAAIGLALKQSAGSARGFCPPGDQLAFQYGIAAKISTMQFLSTPEDLNFGVALIGHGALMYYGDEFAGVLAEQRNATLIFEVLDFYQEGRCLKVTKDAGQGNREEWTLTGPVVLVASAEAVRPPYVSHYRRQMAAKKIPAGICRDAVSSHRAVHWENIRPRPKSGKVSHTWNGQAEDRMSAAFGMTTAVTSQTNDRVIVADAATCARHLLRYLAHHGFLPSGSNVTLAEPEQEKKTQRSLSPEKGRTASHNTLISSRGARGPRNSQSSRPQIARRPRRAMTSSWDLPTQMRSGRCPQVAGQPAQRYVRRPRRLH